MGGRLTNEVAIVTGGGRGFGRAIAERFAAEGAAVVIVARTKGQIDAVAARIKAGGGRALAVVADVTQPAQVQGVVAAAKAKFGPVDLMVNNAGQAGPFGPLGVVDPEKWWQAQAVHVRAPLMFMSAVLPEMRARRHGRIINVASLGGRQVTTGLSAYGVGHAALIRLTEHVAQESAVHGVAAFAIEPGSANTDMTIATVADPDARRWSPDLVGFLKVLQSEHADPEPRLARCADMCLRLASGRYDGLTGSYLEPDDDFDALLEAKNDQR